MNIQCKNKIFLFLKKFAPLLLITLPYVIAFIIFLFFGKEGQSIAHPIFSSENFSVAFWDAINSRTALLLGFVIGVFSVYLMFNKEQNILVNSLKNEIDQILRKSKIVFESGINEFDDDHLLVFKRILNELSLYQKNNNCNINIIAIDNSDPKTWWSDTMTGYLALLSNWHTSKDGTNNISRIFVCQNNELLSPVFIKTIALHSFMGFETYVFTIDIFNNLFDKFVPINVNNDSIKKFIHKKEFLIWTDSEDTEIPINFKLDGHIHPSWNNVKGYQSFWEIGSDFNLRQKWIKENKCGDCRNFYNKQQNNKNIKIWFDFIAKENKNDNNIKKSKYWEYIVKQYIEFYKYLINNNNVICCKNPNDIPDSDFSDDRNFGIKIKTIDCENCSTIDKEKCKNYITFGDGTNFEFVSQENIMGILKKYYNKINNL